MAAVKPAGPEPMIVTSRNSSFVILPSSSHPCLLAASQAASRLLAPGPAQRPQEQAGHEEDSPYQGQAGPLPAREGIDVEDTHGTYGHHHQQDRAHSSDDDPEDDCPGDQLQRAD